jgi:hypothetical protein
VWIVTEYTTTSARYGKVLLTILRGGRHIPPPGTDEHEPRRERLSNSDRDLLRNVAAHHRTSTKEGTKRLQEDAASLGAPNLYLDLPKENGTVRSIINHHKVSNREQSSRARGGSDIERLHRDLTTSYHAVAAAANPDNCTDVEPVVVWYQAPNATVASRDPKAPGAQLNIVILLDDRTFTDFFNILNVMPTVLGSDGKWKLLATDLCVVVTSVIDESPASELHPHDMPHHRALPLAMSITSSESKAFYIRMYKLLLRAVKCTSESCPHGWTTTTEADGSYSRVRVECFFNNMALLYTRSGDDQSFSERRIEHDMFWRKTIIVGDLHAGHGVAVEDLGSTFKVCIFHRSGTYVWSVRSQPHSALESA